MIQRAFTTFIYQERLAPGKSRELNEQLMVEIADIADIDQAGRKWSQKNYRNGFTSYASANELHRFSPTFGALEILIDRHVKKFSAALDFDLGGRPLKMSNCWVNVMPPNAHHGMHLHPLSVLSGTYYVSTPKGASCLKFEDPRQGLFMGAPPRKEKCRPENRGHREVAATAGNLVLFESWLRHEVPLNASCESRVSISFNYGWGD